MPDIETLKWIGIIGGGAVIPGLLLWLLLARTIPNIVKDFKAESAANRATLEKLHMMIHDRAEKQMEKDERLIDTLRIIADRLTSNRE